MCTAIYNKNTSLRTGCRYNASMITSPLYVKMQSVEYQPMVYEELTYNCMSDECNSQSTFRRVWNQTASLFEFVNSIEDWLRSEKILKILLDRASEKRQKKMKDRSYMHVTTSNYYPSIAAVSFGCIYIVLVIVSCIFCYIKCRSRSEGYATTPTSV
jgi:hypothetical protein